MTDYTYCDECYEDIDLDEVVERDGQELCWRCASDDDVRDDFPMSLEYDEGGDW